MATQADWDNLHRKMYRAFSEGKLQLVEPITLKELIRQRDGALKVEEYEAVALFNAKIDKIISSENQ